ncbi:hypothetical protein BN2497_8933 [Janthinobacterium sp. CG23_2]|nr:hypothetical protein BN2497_8933 [Janthinobacterium sp. CG23_2]CUU30864.1 hypothetical protein BN3177_8933 [Janthinobacterium sp. CG23_2]
MCQNSSLARRPGYCFVWCCGKHGAPFGKMLRHLTGSDDMMANV